MHLITWDAIIQGTLFMSVERINFHIQQFKQGGPNTESTKGWCLCTVNQTGRRSCTQSNQASPFRPMYIS